MKKNLKFYPKRQFKLIGKNSSSAENTITASYRGFISIDQEMERDIALQWFTASGSTSLQGHTSGKGQL